MNGEETLDVRTNPDTGEYEAACVAVLRRTSDKSPSPRPLSKTKVQKAKPAPSISSHYFQDSDEVNVPDYEPGDAAH